MISIATKSQNHKDTKAQSVPALWHFRFGVTPFVSLSLRGENFFSEQAQQGGSCEMLLIAFVVCQTAVDDLSVATSIRNHDDF